MSTKDRKNARPHARLLWRGRERNRSLTVFLVLLLVAVLLIAIPLAAYAFGDFDSHSDYGGSSSSSSRDRDSDGGVDIMAVARVVLFLGDLLGLPPAVTLIIMVVLVILVVMLKHRKGVSHHGNVKPGSETPTDSLSLLKLAEDDPAFNEAALLERVKTLFERMQTCWEDGNIDPLRIDFMPDTWTRFNTQLQSKNAIGETSHVRNIVFNDVRLESYSSDDRLQKLRIRIDVTHNIWTTDKDGTCTMGNENTRKRMEFLWTMTRPAGSVTGGPAEDATHCPNCGAEVDPEAFAECPFCHTPIMKVSADWVISEIEAVSQKTL